MGGHFLFDDDQETPNVQMASFEYPDQKKLLTFEVRHWITNSEGDSQIGAPLSTAPRDMSRYPNTMAYRTFLGRKREPGPAREEVGNHYVNFIEAVRSRKPQHLNSEIEEGHISSYIGAPGQHCLSHRPNLEFRSPAGAIYRRPGSRSIPEAILSSAICRPGKSLTGELEDCRLPAAADRVPGDHLQGMGQHGLQGIQGLPNPLDAAGQVDDESPAAYADQGARESRPGESS